MVHAEKDKQLVHHVSLVGKETTAMFLVQALKLM